MTFLKNLGTFASPGLWPLCICGAVTIPATLSQIHSGSLQGPVPSFNVRAYVKSCHLRHPALLLSFPCQLVDETAHANIHYDSQRHEHEQQ
jgi:hypothetical protein